MDEEGAQEQDQKIDEQDIYVNDSSTGNNQFP